MKNLTRALSRVAVLGACFAGAAFALTCDATLTAQGVPCLKVTGDHPNTLVMGGVYTSPYAFDVTTGGVTQTGVLLSCDDFTTDISFGDAWNAHSTALSQMPSSGAPTTSVKFDHTINDTAVNQLYDYKTVGILAGELMALGPNDFGSQKAGELSFAIWGVFDPGLLASAGSANLTDQQWSDATTYLSSARSQANSVSASSLNLVIWTATPDAGVSQEFLQITAAEPPSIAVLLVELLGALAVLVAFRKRLTRV